MLSLVPELLKRRLIFVTGKGGVGKSTVAIALGMLGARSGLRTIVAELASHQRLQHAFRLDPADDGWEGRPFEEIQLAPGLFTISIDPQHAMEEYLRLKTGPLGQTLGSSKLFQAFAMATPGMRELLSIGKVWELAQFERRTRDSEPYDLVVVDAPATGHGVGILRTPGTFAEIAKVGPIANQGNQIAQTIADRDFTGVVAVTTAEEMPVNETLALHDALLHEELDLDAVIVNARYPDRFSASDAAVLSGALTAEADLRSRAALRAALSERTRAGRQSHQHERLDQAFPGIVATLPFVFAPILGPVELQTLADALNDELP